MTRGHARAKPQHTRPRGYVLALLVSAGLAAPARAAIEQQAPTKATAPAEPRAPQLTKAPQLLQAANPEYPPALASAGVEGEAVVWVDLDEAGGVSRVTLASASHPAFAEPALTAATQLLFSPAEIDGAPAAIRIEYRFHFAMQAPEPPPREVAPPPLAPVNLRGRVREAGTRRPVAGAALAIGGAVQGLSDARGEFAVRGAPVGRFLVRITAPGYEPYEIEEELAADEGLEADYYLVRLSTNPYETVVRARAPRREASKVQLERRELEKVPGTFGDPVRVIENLPGLGRVPGGLGGALLVRGANPEDTRTYMDGVEVPQLYHFFGLTSVVPAEFLESIDFFPGGFNARYGRATGGIVDVQTRALDCDTWRASAKVDLVDSAAYTCVPVGAWQLAVAARRSYFDLFIPIILDAAARDPDEGVATLSPTYFDYQLKAARRWGSAHTLELFAFGSSDELSVEQRGSLEDVNFDVGLDVYFSRVLARHRYRPGGAWTLASQVAFGITSTHFSQRAPEIDADLRFELDVPTLEWREAFEVELAPWLTVSLGLDHRFGWADVGFSFPAENRLRTFPTPTFDYARTASQQVSAGDYSQAYWLEGLFEPGGGWKLVPSVRVERIDFFQTQGWSLQPRFAARWQVREPTTLKASLGLYEQAPQPPELAPGIGNPRLLPERAIQYVAGVEQAFTETWNLDVQGFYTARDRLVQWSSALRIDDGRAVPENYNNDADGSTVGLEVLLRRLATPDGGFFGWVAYTLSRSLRRDTMRFSLTDREEDDSGLVGQRLERVEYLAPLDQTHILTVVGQWRLPWAFEAGFRFRLVSGNPFTPNDRGTVSVDVDTDRYTVDTRGVKINSERLPMFHQLDVRIDRVWTFDLWKLTAYLEILNVYNRKNVESYSYDYRYRERAPLNILPIVPILGVKGEL